MSTGGGAVAFDDQVPAVIGDVRNDATDTTWCVGEHTLTHKHARKVIQSLMAAAVWSHLSSDFRGMCCESVLPNPPGAGL